MINPEKSEINACESVGSIMALHLTCDGPTENWDNCMWECRVFDLLLHPYFCYITHMICDTAWCFTTISCGASDQITGRGGTHYISCTAGVPHRKLKFIYKLSIFNTYVLWIFPTNHKRNLHFTVLWYSIRILWIDIEEHGLLTRGHGLSHFHPPNL